MRVIRSVSIGSIQMDRHPLNPSTLSLIKFLEGGGDVPPIHVQRLSGGNYKICDGRHRVTAFRLLGRREIPARFSLTASQEESA